MENRERARIVMDALLQSGDRRPLVATMAEDVTWRWMGVDHWSKAFVGKARVVEDLFGGVDATLSGSSTGRLDQLTADGDRVVVEHVGRNQTTDGRPYDNNYCWILTFRDGLITEVREYMDTHLATEAFGAGPS